MAKNPPAESSHSKNKKLGCLKWFAICFLALIFIGFFADPEKPNEDWEKGKETFLAELEQLLEEDKPALVLQKRDLDFPDVEDDPDLNLLIARAIDRLEEKRGAEAIRRLVESIPDLEGEDRKTALKRLLKLDPTTEFFPDEIAEIEKEVAALNKLRKRFLTISVGPRPPMETWREYLGTEEPLEGSSPKTWVAYLPKIDASYIMNKQNREILWVGPGRSAEKHFADEQKARKEKIEKAFSAWDGSHDGLVRYVKRRMNDPDSFSHSETGYFDQGDHLVVIMKYRGKNAFGGVVLESIKAKVDLEGNVLKILQ